jgi:hypothetical protein
VQDAVAAHLLVLDPAEQQVPAQVVIADRCVTGRGDLGSQAVPGGFVRFHALHDMAAGRPVGSSRGSAHGAGRDTCAQGAAAHLAQLLQRLARQSHDEFDGVAVTHGNTVAITPSHAHLLVETVLATLPRCFKVPDGLPTDDDCAMPNTVCHTCARESRRLPPSR